MTGLQHDEQRVAWDLRGAWAAHREVRLTLTERCLIRTVVGHVGNVSVTGAFVTIDGWHIPTVDVLAIGKPTYDDRQAYLAEMRRLRAEHAAHLRETA